MHKTEGSVFSVLHSLEKQSGFAGLQIPACLMNLEKSGSTLFIKSIFILNQWNNIPVVRTHKRENSSIFLDVQMISCSEGRICST